MFLIISFDLLNVYDNISECTDGPSISENAGKVGIFEGEYSSVAFILASGDGHLFGFHLFSLGQQYTRISAMNVKVEFWSIFWMTDFAEFRSKTNFWISGRLWCKNAICIPKLRKSLLFTLYKSILSQNSHDLFSYKIKDIQPRV